MGIFVSVLIEVIRLNALLFISSLVNLVTPKSMEWNHDKRNTATKSRCSEGDERFPVCCASNDDERGIVAEGEVIDGLDLEGTRCIDGIEIVDGSLNDLFLRRRDCVDGEELRRSGRVEYAIRWRRGRWKRVGDVGRLGEELL